MPTSTPTSSIGTTIFSNKMSLISFGFLHLVLNTASPKPLVLYRKIDYANSIVKKTIEIIKYFNPSVWFIENPQTGLLKHQEFIKDFDYFDLDHCKYGFPYRKRRRIWTNLKTWKPKPLCEKDCGNIINNKHKETTQPMPSGKKSEWGDNPMIHRQDELYRIPSELINEMFTSINENMFN